MMRERPIIFSGPMVRAILDGRKTQTRRVLRRPENYGCPTGDCPHETRDQCNAAMNTREVIATCPYGREGDRLWIRETWSATNRRPDKCVYRADAPDAGPPKAWRSPIFMPRWASRCTVQVCAVRLELLQDISEDDAIAEGVAPTRRTPIGAQHRHAFAWLWDEINGPHGDRSLRWSANPWVWVISFYRFQGGKVEAQR